MASVDNRARWFHTINIYFIALTYGIAISVYGASLIDVAEIYATNVKAVSYTLMTRGVGSLFACLVGTAVYEFYNGQLVLLKCVLFGGLASVLTTVLPSLSYLYALSFGLGCSMGFIEIGIHVWMQSLWRKKSGPFFHFLNFVFGFGGIMAPFLCEPYLSPDRDSPLDHSPGQNVTNVTNTFENASKPTGTDAFLPGDSNLSNATLTNLLPPDGHSESRVFTAYCLIAGIYAINAVLMIISYCIDRSDFKVSKNNSYFEAKLPKTQRLTVLALFALYLTVGVTCEFGFSQMITTFAVRYEPLGFSKTNAAYLTSLFWASYTLSRMVSTGLSLKLGPAQLIVGSQVIYLGAAFLMFLFVDRSPLAVWGGTALLAFGLSPYWSNGSAWVVQYIQLTHAYMSVTMIVVSSGIMAIPFIIGSRIEQNPAAFLYSNLGLALLLTLVGALLVMYGRTRTLRRYMQRISAYATE